MKMTPEEQAHEDAEIADAKSVVAPAARDSFEALKWITSEAYIEKLRDSNKGWDGKITRNTPYIDMMKELLIGAHGEGIDIKTLIQATTLRFVTEGHLFADDEKRKSLRFIYDDYL